MRAASRTNLETAHRARRARRGLAIYFAIVVALSAMIQAVVISRPDLDGLIAGLMLVPTIASVVARFALKEGFSDVSFRFGGRRGAKAIVQALIFPLLIGGSVLLAGAIWSQAFLAPSIAKAAPQFLDEGPAGGLLGLAYPLTFGLASLGWLLFGVASLRARVYPRVVTILLIIGGALHFIPLLPLTATVFGVAVAWLGFALWTGRGTGRIPSPSHGPRQGLV